MITKQICWPKEAQFICTLKKFPHLSHAKARSKFRPWSWSFSHGMWCHCVQVGQGFRGFLDLREVFFPNAIPGGCLSPQVKFFFQSTCFGIGWEGRRHYSVEHQSTHFGIGSERQYSAGKLFETHHLSMQSKMHMHLIQVQYMTTENFFFCKQQSYLGIKLISGCIGTQICTSEIFPIVPYFRKLHHALRGPSLDQLELVYCGLRVYSWLGLGRVPPALLQPAGLLLCLLWIGIGDEILFGYVSVNPRSLDYIYMYPCTLINQPAISTQSLFAFRSEQVSLWKQLLIHKLIQAAFNSLQSRL